MNEIIESPSENRGRGQALVEYALILALVGIAFGIALAATGPAIGNVFSNTVFNLLGGTPPGEGQAIGGPEEFWLTVTYVAANPQEERALPTRTRPPATFTVTPGPSPTPSPTVPTSTRAPTNTPQPTPTSLDVSAVAQWKDEANPHENTVTDPENWRVGSSFFLGTDDWCGDYYPNTSLTGTPITKCNREYGPAKQSNLAFDWLDNSGPITSWPSPVAYNAFSARWTRPIWIDPTSVPGGTTSVTVIFNITYDDGVRVWYDYAPGCAGGVASGGAPSGTPANPLTYATGCLIVDDWNTGGGSISVARQVPVGVPLDPITIHRLQVDYFEDAGTANISVTWSVAPNPDDRNLASGAADCNWGRTQTSNSLQSPTSNWLWEEYRNGDFRTGMRCYLEFRGYVVIPPEMSAPQFVYWDVWDMQGPGTAQAGWLEVAEYVEQAPAGSRVVDRPAMTWTRVNLRQSSSTNYNWTRNVVDLTNVGGRDFRNKKVAFRFVMENQGGGTGIRRWYIDDVEFRQATPRPDIVIGAGTGSPALGSYVYNPAGANSYWDLNSDQKQDFITSVGWDLTSTNVAGAGGMSWEQSPNTNYARFVETPALGTNQNQMRAHFVELNGWVDVSGSTPDREGETGQPILTFYHGFTIGRYTGLELQYSTTPYGLGPAVWQAVPDPDPLITFPAGRIIDSNSAIDLTRGMEEKTVNLAGIPVQRYRLRFAMMVRADATPRDGWYLDNIYLNRLGRPQFLDYPFIDGAELGVNNWLLSNQWARDQSVAWEGQHAFTDSPGTYADGTQATYANNNNSTFRFAWQIDFNNDTPENLLLTNRNTAGGNNNPAAPGTRAGPAVNPVMSFWHRRILNANDNLFVEWRKATENDTQWKTLWAYTNGMTPLRATTDGRWSRNVSWEYVWIDLQPITSTFTDLVNLTDDDVLVRFRLNTDNSNTTDDGIYLDMIRLENRVDISHKLWPGVENRTIGATAYGNGTSATYFDDFDGPARADNWLQGGGWRPESWEANNGIYGLHDSTGVLYPVGSAAPVGAQTMAPTTPIDYNMPPTGNGVPQFFTQLPNDFNPTSAPNGLVLTPHDSFQVLELIPTIDLRATDVAEKPTLYFWSRYDIGANDRISVQISTELAGDNTAINTQMATWCRNATLYQCYDHYRGWSEWTNTSFNITGGSSRASNWTWTRGQINLQPYAATALGAGGTAGKRIRIRFVMDALDNATNRDGWYIDQVSIEARRDGPLRSVSPIASSAFLDNARNLNNWIPEGSWGLDPEVYFGAGGGPATLGTWNEYFWNGSGTWGNTQADAFLDTRRGAVTSDASRTVANVNYDIRRNSPRPGINADKFVGRWTLITPVIGTAGVQQGDYSFITISDDGIRMKYELIDGSGNVIDADPRTISPGNQPVPAAGNQTGAIELSEWNLIYNWTDHGRTADMGSASLRNGNRYRITVEWYEKDSDTVLIMTVGGSNFSFTDSPKQGAGPAFPDIAAVPRANSSLIMDGTLDLRGTTSPVFQYRTLYELEGAANAEVSTDGGFTWTQTGFTDALGADTNFQSGGFSNTTLVPVSNTNWVIRRHNLTRYIDTQLMIRFRLDRNSVDCLSRDNTCTTSASNFNQNRYYVSWWIADIIVIQP